MGELTFTATRQKDGYTITNNQTRHHMKGELGTGFSFDRANLEVGRMSFYEFQPLFTTQRLIEQQLRKTLYLGPFRQPPIRRYPTRGSAPKEVGPRGEAAVTLLANEMVQTKTRNHTKRISGWFELMGLAKSLGVTRVGSSDLFDVNITLNDGKKFPLADLGYGFSQILPVLAQLSFAPESSTLLFEQPKLHLHTLAVRPLAKVFIEAHNATKSHIIAETHSREMFGSFLTEMREGNLDPSKFVAYKVVKDNGSTKVTRINIDLDTFDVYEEWEKGLTAT